MEAEPLTPGFHPAITDYNNIRRIPMTTAVQSQSEFRNLPLDSLIESSLNPRRIFD